MDVFAFWLNHHRLWVAMVIALLTWIAAYAWYFAPALRGIILRSGRPVSWRVDMAARRSTRGGKKKAV